MIEITLGVITAVVIGLTELVKQFINNRYAPIVSILMGVALVSAWQMSVNPTTVITGLVIGLTASGLYSGTKAITKK